MTTFREFIQIWHFWMYLLLMVSAAISLIIYLVYLVRLNFQKTLKEKYDFSSKNEIRNLQASQWLIALAIFFSANTYSGDKAAISVVWFSVRLVVSLCLSVLYGHISYLVLKYYYPAKLNKKLKKYRYTPRVNPETGNTMKLLSEDEEDVYLDEGMQAEENVFSVDYDVWIDPETGTTKIEKYKGQLSAHKCDRCGFQTLRLVSEEIINSPTSDKDGELMKHYKCNYCGRVKRKTVSISHHSKDLSHRLFKDHISFDELSKPSHKKLQTIRIEIMGDDGDTKNFEFETIKEVQKFLDEFDYVKLNESEDDELNSSSTTT